MIKTIIFTIFLSQLCRICECFYYKQRRFVISHKNVYEHHSVVSSLCRLRMADATCHKLLEDLNVHGISLSGWNYWFYEKGMQTSTDDVLVALVALYRNIPNGSNIDNVSLSKRFQKELTSGSSFSYIDLGCGVGSILFLVSHGLLKMQYELLAPLLSVDENNTRVCSIGLEVQEVSAELARRSVRALPVFPGVFQPNISIQRMDIREIPQLLSEGTVSDNPSWNSLQSLKGKCNLLTANPPYFPHHIGTLSGDSQLRNARFELHGGIEEYCLAAKELLCPAHGLFVFSFCTSAVAVAAGGTIGAPCSDERVPSLAYITILLLLNNDGSIPAGETGSGRSRVEDDKAHDGAGGEMGRFGANGLCLRSSSCCSGCRRGGHVCGGREAVGYQEIGIVE